MAAAAGTMTCALGEAKPSPNPSLERGANRHAALLGIVLGLFLLAGGAAVVVGAVSPVRWLGTLA